jgi:hypothetical protein
MKPCTLHLIPHSRTHMYLKPCCRSDLTLENPDMDTTQLDALWTSCSWQYFHSNRFLDPIYFGDYPAIMRENVGNRLPHFSEDEILLLRGCLDFIGINHYTSRYTTSGPTPLDPQQSHHFLDQCVIVSGSLSLTHLALIKYFTTKWHKAPWALVILHLHQISVWMELGLQQMCVGSILDAYWSAICRLLSHANLEDILRNQ